MMDGSAFGKIIQLKPGKKTYVLELKDLEKVNAVLLPRPYPTFLPYYSSAGEATALDLSRVESLQIGIGPGLKTNEINVPREMYIGRVWLE
jgi:hypothetical protein